MPQTATVRLAVSAFLFAAASLSAVSQTSVGASQGQPPTPFRDTSLFHPPAGQKVAIVEFEDLECPACGHAFPIVHAAADHYHIPIVRYDYPLHGHIWSHDAAVIARYLQDKVSPDLATEYRREVFASQYRISSKDDLHKFTEQFFQKAGKPMPFVMDPNGLFTHEVDAEYALGDKEGLNHTPTIVVVTPKHWIEVLDVADLYNAIDQAEAEAAHEAPESASAAHRTAAKR